MRSLRYFHLDVFTDRPLEGNQLAVFTDGAGVDAIVMQRIAREMAFPESTFVLPKEDPSTDVRMRIFTPSRELPMAGHPTVGSTFALAHTGVIEPGRERFVFGLGVGPTRVDLDWTGDRLGFAWMYQQPPTFGGPLGCYLVARGLVAEAVAGKIVSDPGVRMGRPSQIHVAVGLDGKEIVEVKVGGKAVVLGEGTLSVG